MTRKTDIEAFKKWSEQKHRRTSTTDGNIDDAVWMAACSYKNMELKEQDEIIEVLQSEIEKLKEGLELKGACPTCEPVGELNVKLETENKKLKADNDYLRSFMTGMSKSMQREIEKLQAENKKLRECVLSISKNSCCEPCIETRLVARQCLKELGES